MSKDVFYHTSELKKLENIFLDEGYIPLYKRMFYEEDGVQKFILICGYLVNNTDNLRKEVLSSSSPDISNSVRGVVMGNNTYKSFAKDGFEPIVIKQTFDFGTYQEEYFNISEELVYYFNLFRVQKTNCSRKYYKINNSGEKELYIDQTEDTIIIKYGALKEYLAIRHMTLVFSYYFDSQINSKNKPDFDLEYTPKEIRGVDEVTDRTIQNTVVKYDCGTYICWKEGKVLLLPSSIDDITLDDDMKEENISFIVGIDENGDKVTRVCERTAETCLLPVYFTKDVLDKYHNHSEYLVEAFCISTHSFRLKIDNDNPEYVMVFLGELARLPYKEMQYWRSYNVRPNPSMNPSASFSNVMLAGNWNQGSDSPDLKFKEEYDDFRKDWLKKYEWDFFRPLNDSQKHSFESLHAPTSNNKVAFATMIECLALVLIECLNDIELSKYINFEKNDQSITKLGKYFVNTNYLDPDGVLEFFKNLRALRSKVTNAHRQGSDYNKVKKIMEYFNINRDYSNIVDASNHIFALATKTLCRLRMFYLK